MKDGNGCPALSIARLKRQLVGDVLSRYHEERWTGTSDRGEHFMGCAKLNALMTLIINISLR